ncbi:DUF4476 domain-containing protein [Cystobacter ferrugineus]|uniref:DUF4476 domain-containing protein n=1 Tax=Cystobacter ferrugineus TaxID=83449 RepID=A0A1L9B0X9_9BACT|nr:DUF4476 domain-containing protein [Cystobacter ferrugineus]OJH35912.1 hypothetical protein BON30_35440 [Cystobacter ferrugineus]
MKALFAALALLTAFAASAQTPPPSAEATGLAPPGVSASARSGDAESWRGGRSTQVVVEREDLERRLARLESLLKESERGRRGDGRLNEAYQELAALRQVVARAPEARGGYNGPPSRPPAPPSPAVSAVSEQRLRDILNAVSRESFSSEKLRVLETASRGDYFLVSQVARAVDQFSFSADRLSVVRMLWPRVLDRQNGYQLNGSFSFSNDKQELQRIISG